MQIHDRESRRLLGFGKFQSVLERLAAIEAGRIADDPALPPAPLRAGAILTDIGRYREAAERLEPLLDSPDGSVRATARACLALGRIHADGDLRAGRELLREALADCGDSPARGFVLHVAGVAALKAGNVGRAIETLLAADRIYREHADEPGRSELLDTLGQCFELQGRPERAVAHYARSIVKKALAVDRLGLAITLGNLGRLNLRLGYFDDALACFEEDLALSRELGDRRGEVRMQADRARTLLAAERMDEADAALTQALEAARAHGGPRDEMLVRKDRAHWHALRGDPRAALAELDRARECLKRSGPVSRASRALLQALEGKALVSAGELERGIGLLRQAVVVFSQRAVRGDYLDALRDLVHAYRRAGLKSNARRCCHQALRVARRMGFPLHVNRLEADLREVEAMRGVVHEQVVLITEDRPPDGPGGYELLSELGRGGFGVVYKALDRIADRVVAVKVLDLAALSDLREREWRVALFLREAEVAGRVEHPSVARIHAQDRDAEGGLLLVMDFIEGEPLDRRLHRSTLAPAEIFALARGVTGALQAIHRASVLHRDLKPANIIVRPEGTPVVVDFGIALLFGRRGRTASDLFSGTFAYAAPEQLAGRPLTVATDLYALGVVLYEAATGSLPVNAPTSDLESWRHAKTATKIPSLRAARPELPERFSRLVSRLLAPRPSRRPSGADAVMDVLLDLGG